LDNYQIATLFEHVSNYAANKTQYDIYNGNDSSGSNGSSSGINNDLKKNHVPPTDLSLTDLLIVKLKGGDTATNFSLPTGYYTLSFNLYSNHTILNDNSHNQALNPETKLIAWDVLRIKRVKR